MKEQNLAFLKDNLKYMGFGEQLYTELEHQLKTNASQFQLHYATEINKKSFSATLNFRKSGNSDMYFLNSYHASLQRPNGTTKDQVFYLNKGKGITAKEAYNLLEGRAVLKELTNKEGEPYKAWIQLNFEKRDKSNNHEVHQYHEKYGYDLKEALSRFAIVELKDSDKHNALLQSLQKGNIQSVTMERDGSFSKMFIEANPQFKSVNLYDGQLKRIQKEALGQYQTIEQTSGKEVKQEQKQEVKQENDKGAKQKTQKNMDTPKQAKSRSKSKSVHL